MTGKINIKSKINYFYTYNNEAIVGAIFKCILNSLNQFDLARGCLVLPFLLDDKMVNCLLNITDNQINLSQLIKSNPRLFISFNKRYISLLPLYINFVTLFQDTNEIEVTKYSIKNKTIWNFENADLGSRFSNIKKAIPIFLKLTNSHTTPFLYKLLKVKL